MEIVCDSEMHHDVRFLPCAVLRADCLMRQVYIHHLIVTGRLALLVSMF
jgi:hypothetical protein